MIYKLDNIDRYNHDLGIETLHPLVTVCNLKDVSNRELIDNETTWHYGVYAMFLKNTRSCMLSYGHKEYDYSDGTVTSFAPMQTVTAKPIPGLDHDVVALLFHPDLIRGTSLGQNIADYSFFHYSSDEALHLSERERSLFLDCIDKIKAEIERPIDKHSRKLICRNIELLLDYCMRFYDRQFITREDDNRSVMATFEQSLNDYFHNRDAIFMGGLPSVKLFADKCCLSPNYFGDLVKKETGKTPVEYIQAKVVEIAKEELHSTDDTITEIAYRLGFQSSQHFNRYFKRITGITPTEFRKASRSA
ncbi:MAG: helix-turn-helix transcriptional regulator [Muribaculaceae bacterium]|nr:helix-turn-helix transcriptional regulator [Muribaculaceae bacterium]MBR5435541.1 helix-turn-helix transcriptional regulator [Muribaculaceae bacterium]MBR5745216.1 helix-turn-helix transcriptional regulator [Muribaculaceae bacterium]